MDPDDWYPDKEILETLYVGAEKNNVSIAGGSFMDYHDGFIMKNSLTDIWLSF